MEDLIRRVRALSETKRALLADRLDGLGNRADSVSVPGDRDGDGDRDRPAPEPDRRLVAYVEAKEGMALDASELRERLERELPGHLVPSAFVLIDALPRGPTGKVDRASLPDPDTPRPSSEPDFAEPQTEDELRLTEIWKEVLGLEILSVDDSFFEIGGHSLLAIRLLGRIREAFDVELPMDALFEFPTVRGTLESIETLRWATNESEPDSEGHESVEL